MGAQARNLTPLPRTPMIVAMIRAKLCFAAEGITTDRDTNQVSAYSLVEHVEAPSYPVVMQRVGFFCLWERAPGDPTQCRAELSITLDGEDLLHRPVDIDFGAFLSTRCTIRIEGIVLRQPGALVFRLSVPGHESAAWAVAAGRSGSAMGRTDRAASLGARPI
jgi:hypothetical protein